MTSNVTSGGRAKPCSTNETLQQRLACIADAGPTAIEDRLAELESEWTAGRASRAVIGVIVVAGFVLAAFITPWWLILPAIGGVFLLQNLYTRTPLLARFFHSIGYRTGAEVDQEKTALKVLRGDFRDVPTVLDIEKHDDISRLEGEGGITIDPDESKVDPADAAKSAVDAAKS